MASALTTIDNPYDPFDEFEQWLLFDEEAGYHSCEYLARLTPSGSVMSDEEYDQALEMAIDMIVLDDPTGLYKKVTKNDEKDQE